MSDTVSDPIRLLGMLCTGERLRAFAAVVLGARTRAEVGQRAELPAKATLQALTQLEREGLVERSVAGWEPRADTLREAVVAAAPEPGADDHGAADASEAAVFRAFLRDGRLTAIPAQRRKRLVILEHLARMFEPGVYYNRAGGERHPAGLPRRLCGAAPLPCRRGVPDSRVREVLACGR